MASGSNAELRITARAALSKIRESMISVLIIILGVGKSRIGRSLVMKFLPIAGFSVAPRVRIGLGQNDKGSRICDGRLNFYFNSAWESVQPMNRLGMVVVC